MAEGTKVRLVRCPKCENLLPELPDFAVYQCGGCGAVLQVENKSIITNGSPEKSDEERVKFGSEKLESVRQIDGVEIRQTGERAETSNSSSSSRSENKEVVIENMGMLRHGQRSVDQETGYGVKYKSPSKAPVDNWIVGDDHGMNNNKDELGGVNADKGIGGTKPQIGIPSGSRKYGQIPNWWARDRDGTTAYRRTPKAVAEGLRFSNSPYTNEGPSNYHHPSSNYVYAEPIKHNPNGLDRVEYLEKDRAELLRKLEELKDQLSRSCEVEEKLKEKVPVDGRTVPSDPYGGRDVCFPEGSSGSNRASLQPFLPDKHARRPPYLNHSHEPVPLVNRHHMDVPNFYPPMYTPNEIPGYGDLFGPQMLGRAPNQQPINYPQRPSHDYYYGQYMDTDPDRAASYPNNTVFHQPACSCLHCYNKNWQVPAQVPPAVLCNRRFLDAPTDPMVYHVGNLGAFGPRGYNPMGVNHLPLHSRESQPHARRPSDLDLDMDGFGRGRAQRALTKRNGHRCHPIAGGAPFITCHNCFELLKLPSRLFLMEKNQWKLRCGACSTVISFLVENEKLVVSIPAQNKEIPPEGNDNAVEVAKECPLHSQGHANRGSVTSFFDDYDNSGYNFKSVDTEPALSSTDERLNVIECEKMEGILSSRSSISGDEGSPDDTIARREASNSPELHLKNNATPPVSGSPLQEHFKYSSPEKVVSKFGMGNRSKRSNKEEPITIKATSRQNSVKDASLATEMEVSFNEYSNTGMSQDSGEVTKEEVQPKMSKGGDSFFTGIIKKSFRDFARSNQTVESDGSNVSINEVPIPDRLVKKAEKKAGPIHPGQYWYDFRAGFWGVMGQPCLGIIPPFIKEFDYPMPEKCAGGNTGVFVNGRELHQIDLDLLATRGLPTTTDKAYIVEISGKLFDDDTGEELDSLGRLAPTVEKARRGYGMRVLRVTV